MANNKKDFTKRQILKAFNFELVSLTNGEVLGALYNKPLSTIHAFIYSLERIESGSKSVQFVSKDLKEIFESRGIPVYVRGINYLIEVR